MTTALCLTDSDTSTCHQPLLQCRVCGKKGCEDPNCDGVGFVGSSRECVVCHAWGKTRPVKAP